MEDSELLGMPDCEYCRTSLRPEFDNVGFTEPDPVKIVFVGYKCPNCGERFPEDYENKNEREVITKKEKGSGSKSV